jgi:hypothetical protein
MGGSGGEEGLLLHLVQLFAGQVVQSAGVVDLRADGVSALRGIKADQGLQDPAAAGLDQAAADAAMEQAYGMNVADYVAFALDSMDFNELMTDANREGVYYVADSTLYIGDSWTDTMTPTPFSVDGDKLTMEEDLTEMGLGNPVFTRVTE